MNVHAPVARELAPGMVPKLTRGQRQLVEHAAAGWTMQEMADANDICRGTVEMGLRRARDRLGCRNSVEMVARAIVFGLIDLAAVETLRAARPER